MTTDLQNLEPFDQVLERAIQRKGSEGLVLDMAGDTPPQHLLATIPDDRYLAAFTKQIFQSGFVWRVVEQKWPDFEDVFFGFDIEKMLMMPDELWEKKSQDPRIIRNAKKVMTIKDNAQMIYEVAQEHGSFGKFIAEWPTDNIIELWAYLKKHGARLGGNTGPYALRFLGKDSFLNSQDNEAYFRARKIVEGGITSKKNQRAMQDCFNHWYQHNDFSYKQLSRILSLSVGDNYAGIPSE